MKTFIRYILNIGFFLLMWFIIFGISVYAYLYSTGDAKPNAFFALSGMASIFISYKLTVKFNRFLLKHLKSNDDSKVEEKKETVNQDSQSSSSLFGYFSKRKKNTVLFIILGLFNKVLIHYFLYDGTYYSYRYERSYDGSFTQSLENVFTDELWLFIPAFLSLSFIVWYFNDKIKAK